MFEFTRPGVEDLAADALLRPASDGDGYELRCPREFEAQVFDLVVTGSATSGSVAD